MFCNSAAVNLCSQAEFRTLKISCQQNQSVLNTNFNAVSKSMSYSRYYLATLFTFTGMLAVIPNLRETWPNRKQFNANR